VLEEEKMERDGIRFPPEDDKYLHSILELYLRIFKNMKKKTDK